MDDMRGLRNPLVFQLASQKASLADAMEAPLRHALHSFGDGGLNLIAKHTVLSLLKGDAVQNMDFVVGGFAVDAGTLDSVRRAILLGRINVTFLARNDQRFPEYAAIYNDIGAVYDRSRNTLLLKEIDTKSRKSLASIVHEAVHAAHDIAVESKMIRLHTEAVAYVAEAVFLRSLQKVDRRPDTFLSSPPGEPEDDVLKFAWNIANKIAGDGKTAGVKTVPESDSDWKDLLAAIKKTHMYSTVFPWQDKAGFDGV
jgi:hypothetical protein